MAQQTRGDILRAARRLFAERGYAATSINHIADAAGVAIQTIYALERIGELRGLRKDVSPEWAQALFALSTNHEAWRELIRGYQLDWDPAEDWLVDALSRALLARQRDKRPSAS